jgi:hypothetical protein
MDAALHLGRVWDRFVAAATPHGLADGIVAVRENVPRIGAILQKLRENEARFQPPP